MGCCLPVIAISIVVVGMGLRNILKRKEFAPFFLFFFFFFGESPHPPSTTIYLLVVDHRTGHVPVERNQPDGERNVESGLHIDPATLEEFACMFLFFFFLFFFW